MVEVWRWIPGFEGYAEVSNTGLVRTVDRTYVNKNGVSRFFKGRIAPPRPVNGSGYPMVSIPSESGQKKILVHRAVLLAFVGPCPAGMQACHKDGNKSNSRLDNLRWDTARENQLDKVEHGTLLKGEQISRAKLTEANVREVLRSQESSSDLGRRFGVSAEAIRDIRRGRNWQHVSKGMSDFAAERLRTVRKNNPATVGAVPGLQSHSL